MWIIETWMGRRVFDDKSFGSFDEATGFISEYANTQRTYPDDDDTYNGICEDLYAVEVLDVTDAITIETQDEAQQLAIAYSNWEGKQRLRLDQLNDWVHAFENLVERFPELEEEFRENALI